MNPAATRNESIKRKMMRIGLLTSGAAVLAISLMVTVRFLIERHNQDIDDLRTHARITSQNEVSAVIFDDRKAAAETLSALSAMPDIVAAVIYDKTGKVFASYGPGRLPGLTELPEPGGYRFHLTSLIVAEPIIFGNEEVATIYLESNLRGEYADILFNTGIFLLVVLGVFLLTVFLFSRLQKVIVDPILELAGVMQSVSKEQNYAIRAPIRWRDEVGILAETFNGMLDRIQARDAELAQHREHLEEEVAARTADLKQKTAFLEALAHSSIDGFLVVDPKGKKIFQNERTVQLWKIPKEVADNPDDQQQVQHVMNMTVDPKQFVEQVIYLYSHPDQTSRDEIALKDGSILDRYSLPVIGTDGHNYGRVWSFRDITERKRAEQELRDSETLFRGVFEQSLIGFSIYQDGRLIYNNPKFADMFGYSMEESMSLSPLDVIAESDRAKMEATMQRGIHEERGSISLILKGMRKDRAVIDVEFYGTRIFIRGKLALIGAFRDVTERIEAERKVRALQAKLREQAIHDPLTGLYNRRYLDGTMGRELALATRKGHPISMIMGDIDHFKNVNDTYGHLMGDEVLRAFSTLLKNNCRSSDIAARFGGEEFLLVMPDMALADACKRAEKLRKMLMGIRITRETTAIQVTASFGVATFPLHGKTGDELIAAADHALYAAKAAGRNRVEQYIPPAPPGAATA